MSRSTGGTQNETQPFEIMTQEAWVDYIFDADLTLVNDNPFDDVLIVKGAKNGTELFHGIQVGVNKVVVIRTAK